MGFVCPGKKGEKCFDCGEKGAPVCKNPKKNNSEKKDSSKEGLQKDKKNE